MRRLRSLAFAVAVLTCAAAPRSACADDLPKIRAVSPTSALRGGVVDVVIEGTNLSPNEDVLTTRTEISLVVTGSVTAQRITVRLTIPEGAAPGPVPLTIKTKSGVVTTEKFVVRMRTPVVARVKPDVLLRGGEYDVTVTGTNLVLSNGDTNVTMEAPLVSKTVGRPTEKEYKLHVTVPADAPTGPKSVQFETTDGKVSAMVIVALAPPVVSKPATVAVDRAGAVEVSLDGRSLGATQPVVLAVPDPEVVVEANGPPTATSIPLKVRASERAVPGLRVLVVRSGDGYVTLPLEVRAALPVLGLPSPLGITRGSPVDVTLPFAPLPEKASFGLTVFPADSGISVKEKSVGVFTLDVAATAPPGPRTLIAFHPWGVGTRTFAISPRPPSVNGLTPSEIVPGTTVDLAIEGRTLEGASISLAVPDPALTLTPGANALTARLEVKADAMPGPRTIAVRTSDGIALAFLSIKGGGISAPSVSSALPTRLVRGAKTKVVLSGSNLKGAEDSTRIGVLDAASQKIPFSIGPMSATSVELTIEPKADTPVGGCLVLIETAHGSTAAAFVVLTAAPSIATIDPGTILRGGIREVTVTGANLVSPAGTPSTVTLAAPGEAGFAPTVASATAEKIVLKIDARTLARVGSYLLSIAHSEGGAAATLRIDGTPPVVDAISPMIVGTPASADLTVAGKNLIGSDGKPASVQVTRIGSAAGLAPQVIQSSAGSLVVRVTTTPSAVAGPHVLIVKTIDGEAAQVFQVVAVPPAVIQRLAPAKTPRNGGVLAAITGTGLLGATGVEFSGKGVTAAILPGGKDTELHVRISAAADAESGDRTFTVTTPGGIAHSGSVTLTVEK